MKLQSVILIMAVAVLQISEAMCAPKGKKAKCECKYGWKCKSLVDGHASKYDCKFTHPTVDYKTQGENDALDTAHLYYTGTAIGAKANPSGEIAGSKNIIAVKEFKFQKAGFTLDNALDFDDDDFMAYFMASYRTFADEYAPNFILFDFKPITKETITSKSTDHKNNIEWVLIAKDKIHEFAPGGSKAPKLPAGHPLRKEAKKLVGNSGDKYEAWIEDAKGHHYYHDDTSATCYGKIKTMAKYHKSSQECCTRLAFGDIKAGVSNKAHVGVGGRMVSPCDIGEKGISGLIDLSGKSHGGRCLNMANFFTQSTDGDVELLMKEFFNFAREQVMGDGKKTKGVKSPVHVYSYGGTRPWLHLRCEAEMEHAKDLHVLWY